MGKKSRSKKGGGQSAANKLERKEKLKQRREQQLEQAESAPDDDYERPYFVGDRVWFIDRESFGEGDNPLMYRGIVKAVDEETLAVTPLQWKFDGRDDRTVRVWKQNAFLDFADMTLRFEVGDRVVCCAETGWDPYTVDYLWPVSEIEPQSINNPIGPLPMYKCGPLTAQHDEDFIIREHPLTFRLKTGQKAVLNTTKAIAIGSNNYVHFELGSGELWIEGTVTSLDVTGLAYYYAVYECAYEHNGRQYKCHITRDVDEHIAKIDGDPRSRLLESIEQDCSRNHLKHLAKEHDIDVSIFRDLVIAKAIHFASYDALCWLQFDCDMHVQHVIDPQGNTLLHQIAMHPHALRFIKTLGKIELNELRVEERLEVRLHCRLNNNRKSWLEILVDRGNIKALDAALSPNQGLGWSLARKSLLNDEALRLLQDAIKKSRDNVMQMILDSFVKFRTTSQRCSQCMDEVPTEKESEDVLLEDTLLPLKGGKAEQNAQLIARFYSDWGPASKGRFGCDPATIMRLGYSELFILFWKADARIFKNQRCLCKNRDFFWKSRENREEFCQPELADIEGRGNVHDNRKLRPDLLTFILCGDPFTTPFASVCSVEVYLRRNYLQKVIRMSRGFREQKQMTDTEHDLLHTLATYLRAETAENNNIYCRDHEQFLKYKLNLLTGDDTVEGRIKILDHLLRVEPQFKAKVKFSFVLDCIRYRQTRFLEYLIEQCYVKPTDMASINRDVHKVASKFTFLKDGNIPKDVSVRTLLCYACVQFDDLQSLAWICTTDGALLVTCNGWNLLTFASYLGRVEIVAYLYTRNQAFDSLVKTRCQRKPYDNTYAAHIAASRGHLILAEALLEMDCPATDRKGKTLESYAKMSEHEFVRAWVSERVSEREKPQALDRMIKKLFKFLSSDSATTEKKKKYIIDSKCLEEQVWKDGEIYWHNEKTPSGFTFSQVLAQCYRGEGPEFALWLCTQTYFLSCNRGYYSLGDDYFWRTDKATPDTFNIEEWAQFKIEETLVVAREYNQDDLVRFLSKPWRPKGQLFQLEYRTKRDVIFRSINVESEHIGWVKAFFDQAIILEQMARVRFSYKIFKELISRGCHPDELKIAHNFGKQIKALVLAEDYSDSDRLYDFNMKYYQSGYNEEHPLLKVFPFCYYMTSHWLSQLHYYLAIEHHTSLLEYCLRNVEGWSAKMEIEVVQIAAYYNHTDILDIFVLDPQFGGFLTNHATRVQSLFTGLVVRGQLRDFERYVANFGIPCDPIKDERSDDLIKEKNWEDVKKSLICTALGCFVFNAIDEQRFLLLLKLFLGKFEYSQENVLYAMEVTIKSTMMSSDALKIHKATGIMDILVQDLDFDLLLCQNILRQLGSEILKGGSGRWNNKEPDEQKLLDNTKSKLLEWIKKISVNGVDISEFANYAYYENCDFMISYRKLEAEQKQRWSNFDIIKNGSSLVEIQDMIANGELLLSDRDYGGMGLAHLAATYNRQDLLKWLVTSKKMSLSSKEGRGRTVLDVARASKAPDTTRWIEKLQARNLIARVVQRRYQQIIAKQRLKRMANAQVSIASIYRGYSTRRLYRGALLSRMEDSQRYAITWGKLILSNLTSFTCWSDLREKVNGLNNAQLLDDSFFVKTDKQLSKAAEGALLISDNELAVGNYRDDAVSVDLEEEYDGVFEQQSWASFRMTSHVVKWLKQGDKKYKTFFVRRMQQLANGERSRILRKRLKGSATTIFETYLEQKSGFRILYTEEGDTKVIWFVSPHDKVSRLMKLIDEAKTRAARQQVVPESVIASLQHDRLIPSSQARREVLLDVVGNVPLKVYDVNHMNLEDIATNSWVPRLHLSNEELRVVEEPGTVLLLGRSGTGKTVCICNRMEYDRQQHQGDSTFRQLFVARSKRLTKYVSGVLGDDRCSVGCFLTYAELLNELESALPQLSGRGERPFKPSTRVDFVRFKDYYASRQELSKDAARTNLGPLIVWTAIRSFLKNSIEAFQSPSGILSRESFSNIGVLGKNRCRVPYDLRDAIYDEFERYQAFLQSQNLWDDCDRIMVLIQRLEFARQNDLALFESVRRSKIYVDETQDYTLELLLFFELSGPSSLFLAGDPAQSVVEGTEFRFEEVRSVAYYAAGNDRKLVPSKPLTVNLNFRSHAGVLNVASLFLDYLFHHFPSSAKQLKKDYGLFQGSRPGVLHKLDVKLLKTLLSDKLNGAVVLCHDDSAAYWRSILDYTLVYGIREAKGLEFKAVIILNFFEELPQQRPWRNLLLGRVGSEFESKFSVIGTHLKLLYTAITRCIERLFFVESKGSVAGDAAVRRLTTTSVKHLGDECRALATRSNVHDIDAMIMTKDEFLAEGLNAAEIAESDRANLDQALASLNRAVFHFEQAGHTLYASKARTHRSSVHFRLENQSRVRNIVNTEGGMVIETKMARIMENLVKEGLLREAIDLFHSTESILSRYTAEHLERDFILKIESIQNNKVN